MGVRDPRFTSKEHTEALSLRNVGALQSALGILKEPKVEKSLKQTEKMFKAIKESGTVVADVLGAFIGAGSAKDVFGDVVSSYADYLSDTFWGGVISGIDFASITSVMTDLIAPIMDELGDLIGLGIGAMFETAETGTAVGTAFGALIGSLYGPLGAMIGGLAGAAVGWAAEAFYNAVAGLSGLVHEVSEEEWGRQHLWQLLLGGAISEEEYWERIAALEEYYGVSGIPSGAGAAGTEMYTEGGIQEFQRGTDYIKRGGMVKVDRGEGITPSGYTGRTEALLMELLVETRKLRKDKAFRNMFKRR